MRGPIPSAGLLLLGAAIGAGVSLVAEHGGPWVRDDAGTPGPTKHTTLGAGPASYAAAVAAATPSVVNIYGTRIETERRALAFRDPQLQQRFGHMLPESEHRRLRTSLGSAVVVSASGLLVTNRHVVADANEIKAELPDGRSIDAELIGVDAETDLAVLRATGGTLSGIEPADPDALQVGDVVLAIGNPFGIGQTVSLGIISATGRTHLGLTEIENFIQTDAAINPGNSGGALVDTRGRLVGINTAIMSQSGVSEGVGFAIPVDMALTVVEAIARQGRVERGWLGIGGNSLTPSLAERFGLRAPQGVLVSRVVELGPAQQAGVRPGDVVTEVDGRPVSTSQDLRRAISAAGPDARIRLGLWRGSERLQTEAITRARPPGGKPAGAGSDTGHARQARAGP